MTEINRNTPIINAPVHKTQQAKTEPNRDQFSSSSRDNSAKHNQDLANSKKGSGDETNRSKSSLLFSETAFQDRLTSVGNQQDGQTGDEGEQASDNSDQPIILANLEPAKLAETTRVQTVTPASAQQQASVDEIAKLVTNKLDAALRPGPTLPPNPLKVSLTLDPATTGLSGISITMTNDTLTVTLAQGADAVDGFDQMAPLNLAQALQARFPKKAIQVVEAKDEEKTVAEDNTITESSHSSLSSLFRQSDER